MRQGLIARYDLSNMKAWAVATAYLGTAVIVACTACCAHCFKVTVMKLQPLQGLAIAFLQHPDKQVQTVAAGTSPATYCLR